MIEVVRYTSDKKREWDEFVSIAKNGTFLFYRDYMDYHSDRFEDCSLMLFDKGKLKSIFPGNLSGNFFYSHQGLTFGGIITLYETDSLKYIEYFNNYSYYLRNLGIQNIIYKTIPQIYKTHPGEEELYVMYRVNAEIKSINLSSIIDLQEVRTTSRLRKRSYNKSLSAGISTKNSDKWDQFWDIMTKNMLLKHKTKPVHTCKEMLLLQEHFPENIELLEASCSNEIVAGAILYKFHNVLKIQYAHASPKGKRTGAIDNIYNYIITNYKSKFRYIDFGTSNLDDGKYINEGLLKQKEGFGARGVVFNIYKYSTCNIIE